LFRSPFFALCPCDMLPLFLQNSFFPCVSSFLFFVYFVHSYFPSPPPIPFCFFLPHLLYLLTSRCLPALRFFCCPCSLFARPPFFCLCFMVFSHSPTRLTFPPSYTSKQTPLTTSRPVFFPGDFSFFLSHLPFFPCKFFFPQRGPFCSLHRSFFPPHVLFYSSFFRPSPPPGESPTSFNSRWGVAPFPSIVPPFYTLPRVRHTCPSR